MEGSGSINMYIVFLPTHGVLHAHRPVQAPGEARLVVLHRAVEHRRVVPPNALGRVPPGVVEAHRLIGSAGASCGVGRGIEAHTSGWVLWPHESMPTRWAPINYSDHATDLVPGRDEEEVGAGGGEAEGGDAILRRILERHLLAWLHHGACG